MVAPNGRERPGRVRVEAAVRQHDATVTTDLGGVPLAEVAPVPHQLVARVDKSGFDQLDHAAAPFIPDTLTRHSYATGGTGASRHRFVADPSTRPPTLGPTCTRGRDEA